MTRRQSLRRIAANSSGRSFQCSRCPVGPAFCSEEMFKFCHEEYIRAFIKGYKQAMKKIIILLFTVMICSCTPIKVIERETIPITVTVKECLFDKVTKTYKYITVAEGGLRYNIYSSKAYYKGETLIIYR